MRYLPLLLCLALPARAEDALDNWPAWRGPRADGSAPRADPPVKWDGRTNIKWKAPLPGHGSSSPVVWGERVFVLAAYDTGKEADPKDVPKPDPRFKAKTKPPTTYHRFVVLCFDRNSGEKLWERVAAEKVPHEGHHPSHSYSASSPVTDGKRVYASFGSFGVYCYDVGGKPLWKRDLGRLHTRLGWGEGASPALHGDTLVLNRDQEADSCVVALDAKTGKTRWRKERDEVTSWATPLVAEHGGRAQVILPNTRKIRSYDLASGKELWECGGMTVNCIPSPVRYDGVVVCVSGYRGAAAEAISLDSKGDVTGTDRVKWTYARGTPYVPSPVLAGERLYFTAGNDPRLTCLDVRTGKALLEGKRLPRLRALYASPVAAAGRLYFTDRDGTTLVLKQSDKVEVLSVNSLGEPVDASPAPAGKQLFLRGQKHLYCVEGK